MTLGRVTVDVDEYDRNTNQYVWGTHFDVDIDDPDCNVAKLTDLIETKVRSEYGRRWNNPSYLVYSSAQEQPMNLRIRINAKYMVNVLQG